MRDKGSVLVGTVLIGLGVLFLLSIWLRINLWGFFWPGLLIVLGIVILMRARATPAGTRSEFMLLGDIDREGDWPVTNEETWVGVGDIDLDFTRANVPVGETTIGLRGFVGDVAVIVPQSVGLSINASGFVTNVKQGGREHPVFLGPYRYQSEGYATVERKIRLETSFFVHDLKLKQI
jgi:predicted membrane protein